LRNVAATLLAYLDQTAAFPPGTCPNPDLASEDRISLWGPPNNWLDLQAGGAYIVMADGSVRWISESTSATVFAALSTIAGGENLPANW
jgi:hypothetical protein